MTAAAGGGLRVDRVRRVAGGGALPAGAANARHRWASRRGVLLAIEGAGVVGLGEASPLPGPSPDDVDAAGRALDAVGRRLEGTPLSLGSGADPLDAAAAAVERLAGDLPPSARFAVETAILDLVGQVRGTPLAILLGAQPGARVEASALLGDPGAVDAVDRARRLVAAGARTLKLKLGTRPVDDDVAAVASLRGALGPSVALIGDANGVWSIDQARRAIAGLAPLAVGLLEQPVAPADLAGLGPVAIPVWADESLTSPRTRGEILALPHLAGVALKPTVLGGLGAARAIAREAARRGLGVAVTHALEGPVALRACVALALALAPAGPRAGLWPHPGLAAWPDVGAVATPAMAIDPGAGLGLTAHERALLVPPREIS